MAVDAEFGQMVTAGLNIVAVPVLQDNYAWLVNDPVSGRTIAIDPGEAQPVLGSAKDLGWTVLEVWTTHWHPDHTGGNLAMKDAGARILGPAEEAEKIPTLDVLLKEGDVVSLGEHDAKVIRVPGHTQGHIAFHFAEGRTVFTGDTLFAMGCGRLFEGTADDMFANMQLYAEMPEDTQVYCGHEYTQSNGRFACVAEPDNKAIAARMQKVVRMRERGDPTVPTTIGEERATNPFMRASSAQALGRLREQKDNFRG